VRRWWDIPFHKDQIDQEGSLEKLFLSECLSPLFKNRIVEVLIVQEESAAKEMDDLFHNQENLMKFAELQNKVLQVVTRTGRMLVV
jgi:hypothetical protein|tara:strand:- start:2570 stop:2827 length:258 start_codon:yes stop_codon:yes gene_type:complete